MTQTDNAEHKPFLNRPSWMFLQVTINKMADNTAGKVKETAKSQETLKIFNSICTKDPLRKKSAWQYTSPPVKYGWAKKEKKEIKHKILQKVIYLLNFA